MDGQIDLFTLLTMVAAVVAIFKLRSVLGRRTGEEETRIERRRRDQAANDRTSASGQSDKVVALPRRDRDERPAPETAVEAARPLAAEKIETLTGGKDTALANGMMAILSHDPDFDPDHFLHGAKQAYEMIVTAFGEGNRKVLRDLLAPAVLEGFSRAITEREGRGEHIEQKFVGINKADIIEAEMEKGAANVTVRFVSQLISTTRDKSGNLVSGDPTALKSVTDIWTFSRDVSTSRARANPNWKLVATQSPN